MSDCFDHQMDAYDSFEAYGYGTTEGEYDCTGRASTYRGSYQTYRSIPVSETTYDVKHKATLIMINGKGAWIPNKMIHTDRYNLVWVFQENASWWLLDELLDNASERLTQDELHEFRDFLKSNSEATA